MQGTVLIHNAEELQSYSRGEEDRLEAIIKGIADAGAKARACWNGKSTQPMHGPATSCQHVR